MKNIKEFWFIMVTHAKEVKKEKKLTKEESILKTPLEREISRIGEKGCLMKNLSQS